MSNVNDSYFAGHYKEIWRALIPSILTTREVDFIVQYFNLDSESKVLDIMCGYGRHSLALARKGISIVAVDNLAYYTDEVSRQASIEKLPLNVYNESILNYKPREQFDLAICMGNSLNFFDATDTLRVLKLIASCLSKGASLLINTWSFKEIALDQFVDKSEGSVGELKIFSASKLLTNPNRIESETRIVDAGGQVETRVAVDYIFSIDEFDALLAEAGFSTREIFSIPGKKKFTRGEPRAYLIAEKI